MHIWKAFHEFVKLGGPVRVAGAGKDYGVGTLGESGNEPEA